MKSIRFFRAAGWPMLVCALSPAVAIVFGGEAELAGTDRDAIGVMAEGYLSNREAFQSIRCRFGLIRAKAASVEEALEGKFTEPIHYQGLWLVDGQRVRYELMCDPEVFNSAMERAETGRKGTVPTESGSPSMVAVPCTSEFHLSDGSFSLGYSPLIRGANLRTREMPNPAAIRKTPFSMDIMGPNETTNPGSVLRACLDGRLVGRFDGTEEVMGVELLGAIAGRTPETLRHKFFLDPKRGFLPIHVFDTYVESGKRIYEAYITDVRECSGGRWFPERSVVVWDVDSSPPFPIQEITIVELHVDTPPSGGEFYLDLPEGTRVSVPGRSEMTTLKSDERVGLRDLAELNARCVADGKRYAAKFASAALPNRADRGGSPVLRWGLVIGSVLALACVVILIAVRATGARGAE